MVAIDLYVKVLLFTYKILNINERITEVINNILNLFIINNKKLKSIF